MAGERVSLSRAQLRLGLDLIEAYAKDLLDLLKVLYALGARTVLLLATTSEGVSRRLLARRNYVGLREL